MNKRIKRAIILAGLSLFSFTSTSLQAKPPHKEKNKDKQEQKVEKKSKKKKLPPGLQKKLNRGGELPPGWQKKLIKGEILDERVYRHAERIELTSFSRSLPVIDGAVIVRVDDRVIRLYEATREIIDILK